MFEYHLRPFITAIERRTASMMPYYGMPQGLVRNGEAIEEVGFGFNKQIITGLLRGELGFDGVVVTDWELVNDNHVGDQVLPARAWGVEHLSPKERMERILEAGADQFGGEECVDLLLELLTEGRIEEARIDESVRRLLLVKFRLGLFDDPYVDEDAAEALVGREDFQRLGLTAQAASITVLENKEHHGVPILPLAHSMKSVAIYSENIKADVVSNWGHPAESPESADVAVMRLGAPFEPRNDLFLESWFHQGSLEFPPGLIHRLRRISEHCPLIVIINFDRPAIVTPLVPFVSALAVDYGSSDRAVFAALTGDIPPRGKLPIEIPRSMNAVRASREDVPSDTKNPMYPVHFGLSI
ncbi:hypothetical protein RKD54_002308 [Pseudarthrobacter sp. SLBN-100]